MNFPGDFSPTRTYPLVVFPAFHPKTDVGGKDVKRYSFCTAVVVAHP
jgi:hypothetical protein